MQSNPFPPRRRDYRIAVQCIECRPWKLFWLDGGNSDKCVECQCTRRQALPSGEVDDE